MALAIEDYIKMDPNNPVLLRDYKKVFDKVGDMAVSGEITTEERDRILFAISDKGMRSLSVIWPSFVLYNTFMTKGLESLEFSKEKLEGLVLVRRTCAEYYSWASSQAFVKNHPKLINYINNRTIDLINSISEGKEDRWTKFADLRSIVLTSLSRGTLSRDRIVKISKVIVMMTKAFEREKEKYPQDSLEDSSVFAKAGESQSSNGVPLKSEIAAELMDKFLSDQLSNSIRTQEIMRELTAKRASNSITPREFSEYRDLVQEYSYSLVIPEITETFEPIVAYWRSRQSGIEGPEYSFPAKNILDATEYAKKVFSSLPDSELVRAILGRYYSVDFSKFRNTVDIRKELKHKYDNYVAWFLELGLISVAEATNFMQMGKEKFQ